MQVTLIDLSDRDLEDVETLSCCRELKRIELRSNKLSDLQFLNLNLELRWIDAQKNCIAGRFGRYLHDLRDLTVLNLSHNQLENVDAIFDSLPSLKSLVLSHNNIASIEGLAKLQHLEALSTSRAFAPNADVTFQMVSSFVA